jgi:hypothetical protein
MTKLITRTGRDIDALLTGFGHLLSAKRVAGLWTVCIEVTV